MKILHSSDLHGQLDTLIKALKDPTIEIWVDTGDFFPNATRGDRNVEESLQRMWFKDHPKIRRLLDVLGGRPAITIPGNHDYVHLAELLGERGNWSSYEIDLMSLHVNSMVWAGFRSIPFIAGEWNGEEREDVIAGQIEAVLQQKPDVLVTHCPPAGILDLGYGNRYGSTAIVSALAYKEHTIQYHLFGHIHQSGGEMVEKMGIKFYNNATKCSVIDLVLKGTNE